MKDIRLMFKTSTLLAIFVLWSVAWIELADFELALFFGRSQVTWAMQTLKAAIYVFITAVLLWILLRLKDREEKRARIANDSRLQSIRHSGLIGIYNWQGDRLTDANQAFLDLLSYKRVDLQTLKLSELIVPEYRDVAEQVNREISERGTSGLYQKELICGDGTHVAVLGGRALVEGESDAGVGYEVDITPLVRAQHEQIALRQRIEASQRLESLAQLAGGIAHDFNNLMGVIVGHASLIEDSLQDDDHRRFSTAQTLKAAERARSLIHKLLAFGSERMVNPVEFSIDELIENSEHELRQQVGSSIEICLRLAAGAAKVRGNPAQFDQLVSNLVLNARDAMPNGGVINIVTSTAVVGDHSSFTNTSPGTYVMLTINDTGIGMPSDIQERMFEPYFSTKTSTKTGAGSGLGLAFVYGIVKQSGGNIYIESEPGKGTSIMMLFPRIEYHQRIAAAPRAIIPVLRARTILVIEDSNELREMLDLVLKAKGYNVITANDGLHAVEVSRAYSGVIDLVLADVVMPRMSGPDAVKLILSDRPQINILFMTGYADSKVLEEVSRASWPIMEKPILPDDLSAKITEICASSQRTAA